MTPMPPYVERHPAHVFAAYLNESNALGYAQLYVLQSQALTKVQSAEPANAAQQVYEGLDKRVRDTYGSGYNFFAAQLFVAHVAEVETFLREMSKLVIQKYPRKVASITFSLSAILDAPSVESLIDRAIDEMLNKLMYEKPLSYLQKLSSIIGIDFDGFTDSWRIFIEAKARRDVGVHNGWACNDVYLKKLKEAGIETTLTSGQRVLVDSDYAIGFIRTMDDLALQIMRQVSAIHWPETAHLLEERLTGPV